MIIAVASAMPSMMPTAKVDAPSTVTMNSGSRLWINSDEMSISIETSPSVHTLAGIRDSADFFIAPPGDEPGRAVPVALAAIGADHCEKSNAAVRSPICARAPGNGSRPKRRVMNLMIEVVSYCV